MTRRTHFFDVALDIESTSSRSVSPKNLNVLLELETLGETFFKLVDLVLVIIAFRSIVEAFEGS